jgi:biopolymer transport protein ExbD
MKRAIRRTAAPRLLTDISITPLLDLVFILLFAFMVVVPLASRGGGRVAPVTSLSKEPPDEREVLLFSGPERLSFRGSAVTMEELPGVMREALAASPALGIVIQTPPDQAVRELVGLLRLLDQAGVTRAAIDPRPPDSATMPSP